MLLWWWPCKGIFLFTARRNHILTINQTIIPRFDKLKWQREDRRNNRKRHNAYHNKFRIKRRNQVLAKFGNRCNNPTCQWLNADGSRGCTDSRCLQIDHVFDTGNQERKEGKGTIYFLNKVLKDTEGLYQLLCANCNWIKKASKGPSIGGVQ